VLFDHMLKRTMRQMKIKAQNKIDLAVEFTRIPLFRWWRSL
jgi:hypothetical protein